MAAFLSSAGRSSQVEPSRIAPGPHHPARAIDTAPGHGHLITVARSLDMDDASPHRPGPAWTAWKTIRARALAPACPRHRSRGALVLIGVLAALQVRSVVRAEHPTLRAAEALAFTVPLFLLLFATAYVVLDASASDQFSESLTRTDALYFVVTVFATVGFGDIAPIGQIARMLTTAQMIGDLLLLGLVFRAMVVAVQRSTRGRLAAARARAAPLDP
jgi:hypothetical protein